MVGKTLGHYTVGEPLGAGGMGEVYLGRDTRLGRKVAIKVLPAEFASDAERLARFEQEARAAAALNHPHIAVLHDIGFADDTHFMVQEYLEGKTLRERVDEGKLPLDEALTLAAEVAEALATAHRAGIVHRDLKPANVFVTTDGHAKVLDFGLAKLTEVVAAGASGDSRSPTMLGTVAGQVMGTAGYMSPEQAEGEADIDQRADVFAFGCLLFELVTGRPAFSGKNVLDTLHRIANSEPSRLREIDAGLPADLQRILDKSLAKRRSERYQHADDLGVDLRALRRQLDAGSAISLANVTSAAGGGGGAQEGSTTRALSLPVVAAVVALAMVVTATAVWQLAGLGTAAAPPAPLQTFTISDTDVVDYAFSSMAVSPDGRSIVYSVNTATDGDYLRLRSLDRLVSVPIPGTQRGRDPFFSPESDWLGFERDRRLYKVPLVGGDPFMLCECLPGASASWSDDGFIYGATESQIGRVAEVGGEWEVLVEAGEVDGYGLFGYFSRLPGTNVLLGGAARGNAATAAREVVLFDYVAKTFRPLLRDAVLPTYVSTGHLLFNRGQTVYAVPFHLDTLTTSGRPTPVLQPVTTNRFGAAAVRFSDSGVVVYFPQQARFSDTVSLAWVQRDGSWERIPGSARDGFMWTPRLSPDGRRVALASGDESTPPSIWLFDLDRGVWEPFESGGSDLVPVWSPDGLWIYFSSDRDGRRKLYRRRSGREAPAEVVAEEGEHIIPTDVSPDGAQIIVTVDGDIVAIPADGGAPEPVVESPADERHGTVSPDGRWLAYTTDESGSMQVEIRPFGSSGEVRQASNAGGHLPVFSHDGTRLYYRSEAAMYEVDVGSGDILELSAPRQVIQAGVPSQQNAPSYTTLDDQSFLMATSLLDAVEQGVDSYELVVMLNWLDELKRLVPPDGSR